jgi:hypothetical protein
MGDIALTNNANNAITSDLTPGAGADATLSGSIGGTVHVGDVITATFALSFVTAHVSYVATGTTAASVAAGLAAAINANATLAAADKVSAGTLEVGGAVSGGGKATISGKGVLELDAPQNALNVVFASASTGELKLFTTAVGNAAGGLDPGLVLQGTIFGFGANKTQSIDLVGVDFASANKSYSGNNAGGSSRSATPPAIPSS